MYYFSDNSIYEITKIVYNITILFPQPVQERLLVFVNEITLNKSCELVDYDDILSLLQGDKNKSQEKKQEKNAKNKIEKENAKQQKARKQLEYLVMMMITKAFVSSYKKIYTQNSITAQEVKK